MDLFHCKYVGSCPCCCNAEREGRDDLRVLELELRITCADTELIRLLMQQRAKKISVMESFNTETTTLSKSYV